MMLGIRHALSFASLFAIHLFSEHEVLCAKNNEKNIGHGVSYANFVRDAFHYLNATKVGSSLVTKVSGCTLACVDEPTCVSFNVAAQPVDNFGHLLCELLATDKYNASEQFRENPEFHYYSIYTPCSENPCKNGATCIPSYSDDTFKCHCAAGFEGGKCDRDVDECEEKKHDCSTDATCHNTRGSFKCECNEGYQGDGVKCACSPAPQLGCYEHHASGVSTSGVYCVDPDGEGSFPVYCDMTTDGGGWTVFQRRRDGSQDFYLGWSEYKEGFGQLSGEFWLGLDKIHRLTASRASELRVEIEDWKGGKASAKYGSFGVGDEKSLYMLSAGSYSGTAGDSLEWHNNMKFSTKDRDNDLRGDGFNCAETHEGAWWYSECHSSSLNGRYLGNRVHHNGVNWFHYNNSYLSMKFAEMKLRPT